MEHIGTQVIETERLSLRPFQYEDAPLMFERWANDVDLTKYMRWVAHKDVSETERVISMWVDAYSSPKYYHWAMVHKTDGLIGSFAAFLREADDKAEIGYCIGRAYWGNGYVTEAAIAVNDYMFERVGVSRIEAYHSIHNPASGRVMSKAGLVKEGHAKQYYRAIAGQQDADLYGITREMWEVNKHIAWFNALPCRFDGFVELPGLTDGEISLSLEKTFDAIPEKKYVPSYRFGIVKDGQRVGEVNLRIGYTTELFYGGNIGYGVDEPFRGHHYAAKAVKLLAPVLKVHGMTHVTICNDVKNAASYRTCEIAGASLLRTCETPEWTQLYADGQRGTNVFVWSV